MKQMFLLLLYLLMLPFQVASQTCEWSERVSYCCVQIERFTIDGSTPTGIDETVNGKSFARPEGTLDTSRNGKSLNSKSYTLDGCRLSGKPTRKGIYIYNGKLRINNSNE